MLDTSSIKALLLEEVQPLEVQRKRSISKIRSNSWYSTAMVPLGMALFIGLLVYLPSMKTLGEFAFWFYFFLAIIFILIIRKIQINLQEKSDLLKDQFESRVKNDLYQGIFKRWNDTITYLPKEVIDEELFRKAALHNNYSIYKGDDYCEGTLPDGRRFQFSEVLAQRIEHYSDGYSQDISSHNIPVFKGLFFVLEDTLPFKGFDSRLKISPPIISRDSTQKKKKKKLPPPSTKKPNTSSYNDNILDAGFSDFVPVQQPKKTASEPQKPLFDRLYEVTTYGDSFTKDKLPSELCEQLNYWRTVKQQQISVSFYENKAYFTTRHQLDFWPVSLEHSLLTDARVQHLAWNFTAAFSLLEMMAKHTIAKLNGSI